MNGKLAVAFSELPYRSLRTVLTLGGMAPVLRYAL